MAIRLRMKKYDDEHIELQALLGIQHFGFGTFLCEVTPQEIESDEFAKNALLCATEKTGLNGMEIWADNRIAWGSPATALIMPIAEISKMNGAEHWLRQIMTTE